MKQAHSSADLRVFLLLGKRTAPIGLRIAVAMIGPLLITACTGAGAPSCSGSAAVAGGSRSGALTTSETWSGEILVTGDIDLGENCVLTIEPGTTIKFAANSDDRTSGETTPITDSHFPSDPPKKPSEMSGIRVFRGSLKAVGTLASPITFTSASPTPVAGDWHSIEVREKGGSIDLQHTVVEYGYFGVQLSQAGGTFTVNNNVIRQIVTCGICLSPNGPQGLTISGNTISANGHEGIDVQTNVVATITGNTFENNRGMFVADPQSIGGNGVVLNGSRASVSGNTFNNNNTGINCVEPGNNSVGTNTFTGNDDDLGGASNCPL